MYCYVNTVKVFESAIWIFHRTTVQWKHYQRCQLMRYPWAINHTQTDSPLSLETVRIYIRTVERKVALLMVYPVKYADIFPLTVNVEKHTRHQWIKFNLCPSHLVSVFQILMVHLVFRMVCFGQNKENLK